MNRKLKQRNAAGSMLALASVCLMILTAIGVGFTFIALAVGGKKQTEHAVQNGSLTLMQAVCKVSVPYSSLSLSQQNIVNGAFQGKPPSGIDLINYNQLVSYAMMQSQNAVDDKGGVDGQEYKSAQLIMDAVQNDSNSVGQLLVGAINKKLKDSSFIDQNFTAVANANPLGIFGVFVKSGKVHLKSVTPVCINQFGNGSVPISNVSIDLSNPAYSGLAQWAQGGPDTTHTNKDSNKPYTYISGYTAIEPKIGTSGTSTAATTYKPLYAVSINPNEPIHLASSGVIAKIDTKNAGAPPFNGLKIIAAVDSTDTEYMQTQTYVVAGGQTSMETPMLPPSIPGGYIVIKNAQSLNFPGNIDIVNVSAAPPANEMMNGIFISNNQLFTTDGSPTTGLVAWAVYNAAVKAKLPATKPALNPVDPIFDAGGQIATEDELADVVFADATKNLVGRYYTARRGGKTLCQACFWDMVEGPTAVKPCADLRGAFTAAYGVPNTISSFPANNIIAVEAAKAAFMQGYGYLTQHFAEMVSTEMVHKTVSAPVSDVFGQATYVETTTTSTTWEKSGTAVTVQATTNLGQCTNNIGKSPDNDVIVGVGGMQKFPHEQILYASSADPNQDFISFTTKVAQAPTDGAEIKTIKISQDGTILDYLSEIKAFPGSGGDALTKLIAPMTTNYPFCTISRSGNSAKVTPIDKLMAKDLFVKKLTTELGKPKGNVGSLIRAMLQVVPNKTSENFANEVYAILTETKIPMGKTLYVYADPNNRDLQNQPKLMIGTTQPAGYSNQTPNGIAQVYRSSYDVMGTTINPPKEMAITDQLFTQLLSGFTSTRRRQGVIKGIDEAVWTPNTASDNFLGELDFASGLSGVSESNFNAILSLVKQTTTSTVKATIPN